MPGSGIDKKLQEEKTKLKNTNYGPAVVYQDSEKSVPARVRQMPTGGDGTAYMGEKMDLKKADMGDVIKDFYKSDAPQFKGRSKEKRREMAIAAKLEADGKSLKDEYLPEILDKKDKPFVKHLVKKLRSGSKTHAKQADDLEKAMNEQLGGTGPKVAPSSEEMKKKLTKTIDVKTGGTIKKPTVIMPDGKELPGLGGGGGGTDAITAKSKSKSLGKRIKDVGKLATVPVRAMLGIKSKPDPNEKFASESIEDEALTIQDWNSDDVNYTEIETVDIIKPKPLIPAPSNWREDLGEDWQKVNRKDKTDGLSKKAVKAYRRENPGSKLKTAVTTKPSKLKKGSKSAKRRLSFCRRMKGMKKRLTSAKTARDPDSRINKALRRWNC